MMPTEHTKNYPLYYQDLQPIEEWMVKQEEQNRLLKELNDALHQKIKKIEKWIEQHDMRRDWDKL